MQYMRAVMATGEAPWQSRPVQYGLALYPPRAARTLLEQRPAVPPNQAAALPILYRSARSEPGLARDRKRWAEFCIGLRAPSRGSRAIERDGQSSPASGAQRETASMSRARRPKWPD